MFHQRLPALRNLIAPLTRWSKESVAIYLAVAFFPTIIAAGAIVDYSRANYYKFAIQKALNAALLSAGKDGSAGWAEIALDTFNAKLSSKYDPRPKPTFVLDPSNGNYIGTVTGSWPTSLLGIINISSISVSVTAAAVVDHDNTFILNPDHIQPKSNVWSVSKLSGNAYLTTSGGQQTALSEGAILSAGSNIYTGQNGRVLLTRGEETILMAPNSVTGIPTDVTEGISTTIYHWTGSIRLAVEKRNERHFEVITPHLAAVVRGTQFRVTVNNDDSSVEVLKGQVEVTDLKSGQYALVLPGQAAKVFQKKGPPGLSLSGSDPLNAIQQGMPRKSPVNQIGLSDDHFSAQNGTPEVRRAPLAPPKAENELTPRSSGTPPTNFSKPNSQADRAVFGVVFAGALGAAIGAAAQLLWRRRKEKNQRVRRVLR